MARKLLIVSRRAIDPEGIWGHPNEVDWADRIQVPYAPATPASGIGNTNFYRVAWYRKTVDIGQLNPGHQLLLHFGAVDYAAKVWIDGCEAATHEGGYTPFTVNVTPFLNKSPLVRHSPADVLLGSRVRRPHRSALRRERSGVAAIGLWQIEGRR